MFSARDRSIGQLAALVVGIAYLGGGLVGMVFTGLSGFTRSSGTQRLACSRSTRSTSSSAAS